MSRRLPLLLGIVIFLIVLPTLVQRPGRGDLQILHEAGLRLWAGEAVYRLDDPNEHTKPPLATLVFVPLSRVPVFALGRLWDLLNIAAWVSLLTVLLRRYPLSHLPPLEGGLVLTLLLLTPLNSELRLGQYNVLLLWGLVASLWGKRPRSATAGVALAMAGLFKPTFVLLLPWVWRETPNRARLLGAAFATGALLCGVYALVFGGQTLVTDLRIWAQFLPQSSAKHLLRYDNHGLLSFLGTRGVLGVDNLALVLGLGLGALSAWRLKDPLLVLGMGCAFSILFSPMAWLQNYSLLVPLLLWVVRERAQSTAPARQLYGLAVLVLWLGIGFLNPTTCVWLRCSEWDWQRAPLWALLGFLSLASFAFSAAAPGGFFSPARRPRSQSRQPLRE